jgi:uncharacterized protein (DUF305 family)
MMAAIGTPRRCRVERQQMKEWIAAGIQQLYRGPGQCNCLMVMKGANANWMQFERTRNERRDFLGYQ